MGSEMCIRDREKGELKTISYSSLWSLVIETGCALSSFEKETDRPITVGLLTHNQLNGVLVDLACLSFGIRVVPIPLNGTSEHTSYILGHAEITHLFIGGKTGGKLWNEVQSDKSIQSIALNDNESLKGQIVNWEQFLELGDRVIDFDPDDDDGLTASKIEPTQSRHAATRALINITEPTTRTPHS